MVKGDSSSLTIGNSYAETYNVTDPTLNEKWSISGLVEECVCTLNLSLGNIVIPLFQKVGRGSPHPSLIGGTDESSSD